MGMFSAGGLDVVQKKLGNSGPVLERYTDSTRMALLHAREECLLRGETVITVGDLLGGLSAEEDTRAERIGKLKANAFYLRWLVGLPALPTTSAEIVAGLDVNADLTELELDADAKRALTFAQMEADRDREYWLDSDHLLRGLLRFPNKAHFAVLKTELNLNLVRTGSRKDREQYLPEETPNLKVIRYLVRKHATLWVPAVGLACYLYFMIQGVGFRMPFVGK